MRSSIILAFGLSIALGASACGGGSDDDGQLPDAGAPPDADLSPDAFTCEAESFLGCADGGTALMCNSDGTGTVEESCVRGCDESAGGCRGPECTANSTECQGDDLVTCDEDGLIVDSQTCELGCGEDGGAACLAFAPRNLPIDICADPPRDEFVVGAGIIEVIDTDNDADCELFQQESGEGPGLCVIRANHVEVEAGGSLGAARGASRALVMVASEQMVIDGTVSVAARGADPGPGVTTQAGVGEDGGQNPATNPANQGGGGGAYGDNGRSGASHEEVGGGGSGAIPFGTPSLAPLRGGARGGDNGVLEESGATENDPRYARGGGGGGAVQLVSCGGLGVGADQSGDLPSPALSIGTGIIQAGGGGGEGGGSSAGDPPGGGGGGGSGGGILIEAPSVSIAGIVAANGGAAGGGGDTQNNDGAPGQDGIAASAPASGGAGADGGDGGDGGTGEGAEAAEAGAAGDTSGGGGGGGAGRIRINVKGGTSPGIDGATISPEPSEGAIDVL